MDYDSYVRAVGLPEYADRAPDAARRGASLVVRPPHATVAAETVEERYVYPVPADGGSTTPEVQSAADSYNLAPICGLEYDPERLRDHPNTARLVALQETVQGLAEETNADRVAVLRQATTTDGDDVLVTEAYVGPDGRAEYPLTDELAGDVPVVEVGQSGDAVLVDDAAEHGDGYEFADRVASECCCPVLAGEDVVGVVDAEANEAGFFAEERVLAVAGAAASLADSDLLTPPRVEA